MSEKIDSWDAGFGCLGAFVIVFVIPPLSWVVRGWALQTLWAWFVAPTFALAPLTIGQAVGVSFFVSLITPAAGTLADTETAKKQKPSATWAGIVVRTFLAPAYSVLCGWVLLHLPVWGR